MIVKTFKNNNVEIILTQSEDGSYNIVRLVGGDESNGIYDVDYEDADDLFDYWTDMEIEGKK